MSDTNDEILSRIRDHSGRLGPDSRSSLSSIERYLEDTGANRRHWLAATEKPIELLRQAYAIARERADVDERQITNVIFCSAYRVLLEPANAALLASGLGLNSARAFDVGQACVGWFFQSPVWRTRRNQR